MRFKRIIPKILLLLGFLLLFIILRYQGVIKEFSSFNFARLSIYWDNFFYFSGDEPKRNPPISLLEKETELKLYIGQPFKDFTLEEWGQFWRLVYGAFPKENPGKSLPKKVRQLTEEEMAGELQSLYPQPFAFFKEEQWRIFFGLLLKK